MKSCPIHAKIVSTHRCRSCPCAYDFDFNQEAFVDCAGESLGRVADTLRNQIGAAQQLGEGLWYENATPNLGSGFRLGWDKHRSDLAREVEAEIRRGPYAAPPQLLVGENDEGDEDSLG